MEVLLSRSKRRPGDQIGIFVTPGRPGCFVAKSPLGEKSYLLQHEVIGNHSLNLHRLPIQHRRREARTHGGLLSRR